MKKVLFFLLIFSFPAAQAGVGAPKVNEWPEEFRTYTRNVLPGQVNEVGGKFYNEIFNAIDDLRLFQFDKGKPSSRMNINRAIYDNHDIFNSWTVIDRMNINLAQTFYSTSIPLGAVPAVSINMGASGNLNFLNIRRSNLKQYGLEVKLENLEKEVSDTLDVAKAEDEDKWYNLDPLRRAQYFEPLKRLSIPLRLPFIAKDLTRLQNGEIMAFDVNGTISLGAGIGFSTPTVPGLPNFNAGVNYTTYLRGAYRFNIMKESDRFVRIKVTRVRGGGDNFSIGMSFDNKVLYEGFVVPVFGNVGKQSFNVTPFTFNVSHDYEHLFDVCYRYDMSNPTGIAAYEEAMRGNFEQSEKIVQEEKSQDEPSVAFVFNRIANTTGTKKHRKVELGFLFSKQDHSIVSNMAATITTPEGESHVFRSVSENSKEWKSFAGQFEKFKYNFSFYYNRELFKKNTEDSFSLIAEGNIDDYVTSGIEMRGYSQLFEEAVGSKKPIFPRLPVFPPSIKEGECIKWDNFKKKNCLQRRLLPAKVPAYYGRSSFYFRLGFSRPMLEKFLTISNSQIWDILEKAFGAKDGAWESPKSRILYHTAYVYNSVLNAPLYLTNYHLRKGTDLFVAETFQRRFEKVKHIKNPEKRLRQLARLFSNPLYGYELVKVLRLGLQESSVPYTIQGTNKLFKDVIRQEAWGVTIVDHVSATNRRDMDFENNQTTVTLDEKAIVNDLKVTNITPVVVESEDLMEKDKKKKSTKKSESVVFDEDENNENEVDQTPIKIKVDLDLALKPRFVYVKIVSDARWTISKKESETIFSGQELVAGAQTLVYSNEAKTGIGHDLLAKLKPGKPYLIMVSISQDGRYWGPVKSYAFRL
ncbi:MAG: hypothetical protein ACOYL6_10250 [Bacteriovoracaceae bacterium]